MTCQGEAATIVGNGKYSDTIYGTAGADVIVTNKAHFADGLGGDDLICVTGEVAQGHAVRVDDGAGDDATYNLSPTIGAPDADQFSFLSGEGDDLVVGGPGRTGWPPTAVRMTSTLAVARTMWSYTISGPTSPSPERSSSDPAAGPSSCSAR